MKPETIVTIVLGIITAIATLNTIVLSFRKATWENQNLGGQTINNLLTAIKESTEQMKIQDGVIIDLTARVKTLEKSDADKESKIYELTNGIRKLIKQLEDMRVTPCWKPSEVVTEKRPGFLGGGLK